MLEPSKAALEVAIATIVRWTAGSDRKQCAEIIQTALDEARAEERCTVVEWLRTASKTSGHDHDMSGRHLLWVADAIESGKHHG